MTLTYTDQTLPSGSTLDPGDPQKWLKRLRKAISPHRIRFFLVGEYGDETERPHYHAALFGLDPLVAGGLDGRAGLVASTWGLGHSYVGDLTPQSASYICGYVTKKMTKKTDERLRGRYPEFARMSNGGRLKTGGIGAGAMMDVASAYQDYLTPETFKSGSFPVALNHGKKRFPLGRYLRRKLRENMGYGRETSGDEKKVFAEKMRQVFEDERYAAKVEKRPIRNYVEMNQQAINNVESRFKIHNKRGAL